MSSLLHSPTKQNDRQTLNIEEMLSEDEARRRREQLERRPSYRMILKEIATAGDKPLKKEVDDPNERSGNLLGPPSGNLNSVHFEVPTTAHLNNGGGAQSSQQNRQVDTSNSQGSLRSPATSLSSGMRNHQNESGDTLMSSRILNPPRTISEIPSQPQPQLHISGPPLSLSNGILPLVSNDLLNLKPVNESISLSTAMANFSQNNDWQSGGLSYGNAGGGNHSPLAGANMANRQGSASLTSLSDNDESSRKRQVRLLKNREAAKECRRKKKEYVKCLENRVAVLENQNKALIDELKALKEMYCRKESN